MHLDMHIPWFDKVNNLMTRLISFFFSLCEFIMFIKTNGIVLKMIYDKACIREGRKPNTRIGHPVTLVFTLKILNSSINNLVRLFNSNKNICLHGITRVLIFKQNI